MFRRRHRIVTLATRAVFAAALGIDLGAAPDARAQGTIRGVVTDSLLSRAPLAGATVVAQGARTRATTDRLGRFVLRDVPAGAHAITFLHPLLDSLDATAPVQMVLVRDRETSIVALGMPSANSLSRANCGEPLEMAAALVFGVVRDAERGEPLAGALVRANWFEWRISSDVSPEAKRVESDTTDADGRYVLCGVPNDIAVTLVASAHGQMTGELALDLDHLDIGRRDLLLSRDDTAARIPPPASSGDAGRWVRPRGSAAVEVTVLDPYGKAVPDARVGIRGTEFVGTTGRDGRVRLMGLPSGTQVLVVRRPGNIPITRLVPLRNAPDNRFTVQLGASTTVLPAVSVVRPRPNRTETMIRQRRSSAMGRIYDAAALARAANPEHFWRTVPGVTLKNDGAYVKPWLTNSVGKECEPVVWIDGAVSRYSTGWEIQEYLRNARQLEVYARAEQRPVEFITSEDCGALVIWTK